MLRSDPLSRFASVACATMAVASVSTLLLGCAASNEPRILSGPDAVVTPDGLHRVENVPMGSLFIKPGYVYGSYADFTLGDTALTLKQGSRTLDEDELADVKGRFTEAARQILLETGRSEVAEDGPCVARINLALLDLDLLEATSEGGTKTSVVDSFGAVTMVMEIRDAYTGEALLRYGRRQHLIGGTGVGSDPAKGPVLNLAIHEFMVDFQSAFQRSLPRLPPIARTLTCAQRAGLAPFTPEADAIREIDAALAATPDLANGARIYRTCATCHQPQGNGLADGSVPQLAGQHRSVVIKQLADIRAGNRDNPTMYPFAYASRIGGTQGVADVAAYIGTLEMSTDTGKGPGDDLEKGERVYADKCATCHGPRGEGDAARAIPRIESQHFAYLERQFQWIRDGRRRNADPEMRAQISNLSDGETIAVLDYVSRLEPALVE